ncbi:hypothetical protein Pcinc_001998 [Petrolisthes cinctipes]|uniref:DDE-1 domain-containing protein n=1 Tax=Petrolisthes cinctipes TaxID=88211 RepID=A0AAE1GLW5_PETCI|nr:hypothetical protein Pcinc_001998 [Petrolisthes cinctipes]
MTGRVVIIGDNLASHVSTSVIESCDKHNISFVLLPPNSTHLTQPLDVAVFRPLKLHWRKILENFKKSTVGRLSASLPKDCFPALLTELINKVNGTIAANLRSGFRKCGIHPLDPQQSISRLPEETNQDTAVTPITALDSSVVNLLKEMRDGTNQSSSSPATPVTKPKRKKRLTMSPGMSITTRELQRETESQDEDMKVDEPQPQPLQPDEETPKIAARPSTSTSAPNHKAQASPQTVISTQTIQDKVVPSAWVVVRVPFDTKDRYRHYIATIVKVSEVRPVCPEIDAVNHSHV